MRMYVGLDVHSKRSVFVIETEDGRVVARGDIPTTPAGFRQLRRQHELASEMPVALETGTVAFYAARQLARVGLRPVVIDAHEVRVKAHRPRQKSDRRDAFELCEGLRRGQYRAIVHVPPARIGALRETLSRRRHFVAVRVAEVNAVKRLLRAAGPSSVLCKRETRHGDKEPARDLRHARPRTVSSSHRQTHAVERPVPAASYAGTGPPR